MDKFQNIVSIMSSLKQALSALTRQAFKGTQISLNQNCTSCNNTKHAVKLCTSCLAKMNVKCAQSMDVLRELVAHFVKFSSNMFDEKDDPLVNISLKNVIHMLRETLPNIFRVPELQEHLSVLAEKIACADPSCCTCDKEVKAIMMIAKQLLLVISIRDDSAEFTDLAEHLVRCLLDVDFPCCGDSGYSLNSNISQKHESSNENLSESVCIGIDEEISPDITSSHQRTNSETKSNRISLEGDFNTLQIKTEICHDYLKLTHIQSVSESRNSVSPKSIVESNTVCKTCTQNTSTFPQEEISINSFLSDDLTGSRTRRFLENMKHTKLWRSLDSLIKPRRLSDCSVGDTIAVHPNTCSPHGVTDFEQNINSASVSTISNIESRNFSHPLRCTKQKVSHSTSSMNTSSVNPPVRSNFSSFEKRVSPSNVTSSNEENIADFNSDSTSSSSRCLARKRNYLGIKQSKFVFLLLTSL